MPKPRRSYNNKFIIIKHIPYLCLISKFWQQWLCDWLTVSIRVSIGRTVDNTVGQSICPYTLSSTSIFLSFSLCEGIPSLKNYEFLLKNGNLIFYDISCHIYHLVCLINCAMPNENMTLTEACNLYFYYVDYLFIHEVIIFLSDVMHR